MAVPFFEPKTTTTTTNNNSNNNIDSNNNSSNNTLTATPLTTAMQYDQVDGMQFNSNHSILAHQQTTIIIQPTAIPAHVSITTSTMPSSSSSSSSTTQAINNSATPTAIPTLTAASYEQQALAWKILALALCKALKEYYQQTASSKDAFTNQTVQVLPNGQVQPLWK